MPVRKEHIPKCKPESGSEFSYVANMFFSHPVPLNPETSHQQKHTGHAIFMGHTFTIGFPGSNAQHAPNGGPVG